VPRISISSSLCDRFTGGEKIFDVAAADTRAALRALDEKYPGFEAFVDKSMSISIDGEIFQNAWTRPLTQESEVFLIPKIAGG
jgi:molybdopterin converting factor small subunit